MGVIFRQSIQNTVITYLGVALGFVVTIWMYPRILTPEQYGLTRVLLSLAMVSTQLANLGMQNTIIRYFPFFRDGENKHNGFLFIALIVPFIGLLLLGLLLFFFRPTIIQYFVERSGLLVDYYWFVLPLAFFILFFHVITSFVQALYDTVMSSFLMNVVVRLLTIVLLLIYLFGWLSFYQFMVVFVFNYALILTGLFIYMRKTANVSLKPNLGYLKKPLVKNMLNYSIFAFFGGVASIIVSNIDIIMLGSLAGLDDTGIYAIAFYVGSAITIVSKSIFKISSPVIADAFKKKHVSLIERIYHKSALNQIIAGGLVFCGIIANIDNLMEILPPEYAGGALVIVIIGTANLFDMITGINGAIILNSKYYRFDLYSTLLLIAATIMLNYYLIPIYGIAGAALGTAAAVLLYNTLKVGFVWRRFSMQPFQRSMLYVIVTGTATLYIAFLIPTMGNVYVDILIRSTIITALYGLPLWMLNISDELNQLVTTSLKTMRKTLYN